MGDTDSPASDSSAVAASRPFHKLAGRIDLDNVLDRIANGEHVAHIAREYGATPAGLLWHLQKIPDYQQARELGMEMRLDQGLDRIEKAAAAEDLNLARVAEIQLRRTEWRAEREMPHRWGQRTHSTVEHVGDLGERLRQARERVVQGTSTRVTDVMSTDSDARPTTDGGPASDPNAPSNDRRGTL